MNELDINEIIANAQNSIHGSENQLLNEITEDLIRADAEPAEVQPVTSVPIEDNDIDELLAAQGIRVHQSSSDTAVIDARTGDIVAAPPTFENVPVEEQEPEESEEAGDTFEDEQEQETEQENEAQQESIVTLEQSATVRTHDNDLRFQGAPWYENARQHIVTIVGLGGIGSYVSFLISRMHPAGIALWDDDTVEVVNMSGQLYGNQDLDSAKVYAASTFAEHYSNYRDIVCFRDRFSEQSEVSKVTICGLDNMESRKVVFNQWRNFVLSLPEEQHKECLFIDGRMSAEDIQVFCMTGEDDYYMHRYQTEFLFSDEEADATVCSYKQTSFCAAMIGGLISNLYVNFCANLAGGYRRLPFYTEYSAEKLLLKTDAV